MFLSCRTFPVVGTEVVDALTAHSWELAQAFKELRKNLFKSYLSRKVSLARCSNSQSFIHAWVRLAVPSSGTRGRVPTGDFRCGVFQSRCVVLLGWPSSSQGSSAHIRPNNQSCQHTTHRVAMRTTTRCRRRRDATQFPCTPSAWPTEHT